MKLKFVLPICLLLAAAPAIAQDAAAEEPDSLGLPGDNLDLYGVLNLFQKAESMEAFEKALNDENNHINNLDLNEDGEVDYIRVVDRKEEDAHAIVLQVPVSEKESQDVAVIGIEKTGEAAAQLQIVGDEELYGKDYIVEPPAEKEIQKETQGKGPDAFSPDAEYRRIIINVWLWPSVRFIYAPAYVVWVSPWYWRHYPGWWRPWRPLAWRMHRRHCVHYHAFYHRVHVHRVARAGRVYHAHRVASPSVHQRHVAAHQRHEARHAAKTGKPHNGNAHSPRGGKQQQKVSPKGGAHAKTAPRGGGGGKAHKGGGSPKRAGGGGGGKRR